MSKVVNNHISMKNWPPIISTGELGKLVAMLLEGHEVESTHLLSSDVRTNAEIYSELNMLRESS